MSFKTLCARFFGIDGRNINRPYYRGSRCSCGWDILSDIIDRITYIGDSFTLILFAMKLLKVIDCGWLMVFVPTLCHAIWVAIRSNIETKLENIRVKERIKAYDEAYRRELKNDDNPYYYPDDQQD